MRFATVSITGVPRMPVGLMLPLVHAPFGVTTAFGATVARAGGAFALVPKASTVGGARTRAAAAARRAMRRPIPRDNSSASLSGRPQAPKTPLARSVPAQYGKPGTAGAPPNGCTPPERSRVYPAVAEPGRKIAPRAMSWPAQYAVGNAAGNVLPSVLGWKGCMPP